MISKTNASQISLDLSEISMFNALKIASVTSALGLIRNLKEKYEIIVANEVTMSQISLLGLSNISISLQKTEKDVAVLAK